MELFDKALGVHPYSLELRLERAEIIASNLANVDTPGFKARDVDYAQIMSNISDNFESGRAQQPPEPDLQSQLKYRVPFQASADGNTAELNVEQANFASNAMDFDTAMTFLNMKIQGLHKAIRGE